MRKYYKEILFFVNSRLYCGLTLLTAIIAYGYAAVNISIGTDDVRSQLEIGEGKQIIASGRFSQAILPGLLGYRTEWIENSFAIDVIAVLFLILSAVNCCILFHKISKGHISMVAMTLFSSLMLTYPLTNEFWEYTHTHLCVCIGIFLSTLVIYLMDDWISKKWNVWKVVLITLLMTVVCAGYESVVCAYIFFVFAILFLRILFDSDKWSMKSLIKTGFIYVVALLSGIIGRVVIHRWVIIGLLNIPLDTSGNSGISWKISELGTQLHSLIVSWVDMYLLKSIIYFPLTEMVIFGIIYICLLAYILRSSKRYIIVIPGIGMLISFISLSLVQGTVTYYRCTSQVFAFFVAFVGMLLCYLVERSNRRYLKSVIPLILVWLCVVQAVNLNYWLTLNHLRSEEEEKAIYEIGSELRENYDLSKPVVFAGYYGLSSEITELASVSQEDPRWKLYSHIYSKIHNEDYGSIYNNSSRKLPQTNVNSVISWALRDQKDMQSLFEKQGFSINITEDQEIYDEVYENIYCGRVNAYPQKNYIYEKDEYIAVYIAKQN